MSENRVDKKRAIRPHTAKRHDKNHRDKALKAQKNIFQSHNNKKS